MPRTAPEPRTQREPEIDGEERELRAQLLIDDDDLDNCLMIQPEAFRRAADRATAANGAREALELELKELTAQLDGDIRSNAIEDERKLSETQLASEILITPRVKELRRRILASRQESERRQNLKESFLQRSYALKDLTAIQLSRLHNLGVERGSVSARNALPDRNRAATEDLRRQAREGAAPGRYRRTVTEE